MMRVLFGVVCIVAATRALAFDAADLARLERTGSCAECDLRGADLRNKDLKRADLRETKLREADLKGVDLSGADLRDADLRRPSWSGRRWWAPS